MTAPAPQSQQTIPELRRKAALFREGTKRIYDGQGARADMWYFELWHFLGDVETALSASGDVRAAVIEPTDGHGHTGEFTATEFNERAWDHEKAAKNGLSAGPNVSYVRTFQACAVALRYAAKHMFSQSPATDAAEVTQCSA